MKGQNQDYTNADDTVALSFSKSQDLKAPLCNFIIAKHHTYYSQALLGVVLRQTQPSGWVFEINQHHCLSLADPLVLGSIS